MIDREYICNNPDCGDGMKFNVIHHNSRSRNKFCCWCGKPCEETGRYWKAYKINVVGYNKDGSRFEFFRRKNLPPK